MLLDNKYNIKICDFGFATNKDEVKTRLGTKNYMAPEQQAGVPHDPKLADIYSLGVILFVMHSCCFPYTKCDNSDQIFSHLIHKNYNQFWEVQEQLHENIGVKFSDELKDLINRLLSYEPEERPTLDQIRQHPWMVEGTPSFGPSPPSEPCLKGKKLDQQAMSDASD